MRPSSCQEHLLAPESAARPSPSPPALGGAERPGRRLPLGGATDFTTTGVAERGKRITIIKEITLLLSETRGVGPAEGPGEAAPGGGMPLSRGERPGLPSSPRRLPGLGPREPPGQSRGQVGEQRPGVAVLATGRTSCQERGGGAGRFPTGELGETHGQSLVPPLLYFFPKSYSCNVHSLPGL